MLNAIGLAASAIGLIGALCGCVLSIVKLIEKFKKPTPKIVLKPTPDEISKYGR